MIQRFYKPILHTVSDKACIIYPARDESRLDTVLDRSEPGCVERFVTKTMTSNAALFGKASYFFAVPWNIDKQLLLDVWSFELENKSESGPLVTAYTFKDNIWVKDMGTASGDGLIILGYEEVLRRQSDSLEVYLSNTIRHAILPEICRADEGFYA